MAEVKKGPTPMFSQKETFLTPLRRSPGSGCGVPVFERGTTRLDENLAGGRGGRHKEKRTARLGYFRGGKPFW